MGSKRTARKRRPRWRKDHDRPPDGLSVARARLRLDRMGTRAYNFRGRQNAPLNRTVGSQTADLVPVDNLIHRSPQDMILFTSTAQRASRLGPLPGDPSVLGAGT